ncbi:MAG TPA: SMP-30/gluconolactonase/LRE family protein [Polaromonas sp.]|uniref:SMP-30/gluconolactonase/LRE family protein n=1 Tax=Polaromonas sp. TaxID=1869339 RepID=UPI002D3CF9AF|nr:SMP-30/gluconolactonase/LRE family protein [Polaromonas sp.]HYW55559.1 SMP-30/gluconolactonase/LRE family protein [Polaromonas sp.]
MTISTHYAENSTPFAPSNASAAEAASGAGVGVLEKAMGLLNIVSLAPAPMTFTELLRAASLPKATLHRILATLMREGLLRHDPYTKSYKLGFRLLELAHEVWSDFDLRLAAQDEMVRLRDSISESVVLAVLDGENIVIVTSEDAGRGSGFTSKVGQRLPAHATSAGKAILAYLDPTRQAALLQSLTLTAYTSSTLTTLSALRGELDLTRARGYAIDRLEHNENVFSMAAPIFDIEGRPLGAVSIFSRPDRMNEARAHALSSSLIGSARTISHNAGGQFMSIAPRPTPEAERHFDVVCVTETRALLGEGPTWSPRDGALFWVDILTPAIHRYDVQTGSDVEVKLGSMVSVVIPKATGGLLVATPTGIMTFDEASKSLTSLCHPESDRPTNRYNDGKCDRMGRLWIGTLDMGTAANRGNLFRVDPDGTWKKMDSGFTVANGLGWSPDNKQMYFTDSSRRTIYTYDFDLRAGTISNRRPLITLPPTDGTPDGLTVDEEGCLWVAIWDAWRVSRYSPSGEELLRISMPVPRPTSCCFGGPHLDTLYVTSASVRLNEEALLAAPLSGSLFAIKIPGIRGLPDTTFAG